MADLVVAGAGMAGLVAGVRARELGATVVVHEKGDRPGGSMRLSHGVVWRYREWERFRAECPHGEPELQRVVWERLDEALVWLERLGAPVVQREADNPLLTGLRLDTPALADLLAARAGDVRLEDPLRELPPHARVIIATGGFQGSPELVRRYVTAEADNLWLRANPWSAGDGLRFALERGASLSEGMDEFYGRNLPAPPASVTPDGFRTLQQLYAHQAVVMNVHGERYEPRTWSEIDVVQWTARQPGARAWYVVEDEALGKQVGERTVREMVEAARSAGGRVERRDGATAVEVAPGITTTLGGIRIDARARAADGLYACGIDAGGISTGGYSSGLASALVFGLVAAESALDDS